MYTLAEGERFPPWGPPLCQGSPSALPARALYKVDVRSLRALYALQSSA
jgi:hypothetical protein